jgi:hypothetical protein
MFSKNNENTKYQPKETKNIEYIKLLESLNFF